MKRVGAMLAVAGLMVSTPSAAQTLTGPSTGRILVVPFENVTRENRIFWLGEAAAVLLADNLNSLGAAAITRDERREAFEELQVPFTASLTDATLIRIGQIVGASRIVMGTLQLENDVLVVRARSIALEAGRIQSSIVERGSIPDLFATFERIARTLVPASQVSADDLMRDRPPVAAFENYIKGLLAEPPATAATYLNTALQLDPRLDRARLALWEVYERQDQYDRALGAVKAVPDGSRWSRRAHFLAGLSQIGLNKYDDAYATFKALSDQNPSANVWNNLGVVQLRRGGATETTGTPTYFFNKAVEADATDGDFFFNLGYACWVAHDPQGAIYWLREAVRRNVADGEAHFVLGAALSAAGNVSEANREKDLARRLASTYAEWEKRPGSDPVPKGLERIKNMVELPHALGLEGALSTSGQRDQQQLAGFYLDRARRLYEAEADREALEDLARVLYFSPYQAEAQLLVGRIDLRTGRVQDAIDAFKISLWSAETVDAHVALADAYLESRDLQAARAEATRALAMAPSSEAAKRALESINSQPDAPAP